MALDADRDIDHFRPIRRILFGAVVVVLLALFLLWRIDSPRVERLRAAMVDATLPQLDRLSRGENPSRRS